MSFSNYDRNAARKDLLNLGESDDVEDDAFLRHNPSGQSGYMFYGNDDPGRNMSYSATLEEKRQQLLERKKEMEERSLMSTERSLSYLKNSEQVGIAAAEELLRQREQLERTERSLDNINTTLRFSQKHIQGIKSVFGGLKNFFSGKQNEPLPPELKTPHSFTKSPLNDHLDDVKNLDIIHRDEHEGLRIKGQVEREEVSCYSQDHQAKISKNLDDMLGSIYKLKGLAHGLGDEIETHNNIIENVITKTERADDALKRQNKDINKLLK